MCVCVCVCVCVYVSDISFLPPCASRPRNNIGSITVCIRIHRDTENSFIIIVIFAQNASCRSYGRYLLASLPFTTPKPQNTDTNGIHATLLFAILSKNALFRSYSTFVYCIMCISSIIIAERISARLIIRFLFS